MARHAFDIREDAFVALFLGRVVPEKGVDSLLEAWRLLDLDPNEGRLLIVGPIWPPSYAEHLRTIASGTRCHFVLPQQNVVPFLHASDAVVVPSIWADPAPRVVLEAMATGCPVVASASGGIPEMLPAQMSDMLFEPGNAHELAERLRHLMHWRAQDPSLGAICRAHVTQHHGIRPAVDRLEKLFLGRCNSQ